MGIKTQCRELNKTHFPQGATFRSQENNTHGNGWPRSLGGASREGARASAQPSRTCYVGAETTVLPLTPAFQGQTRGHTAKSHFEVLCFKRHGWLVELQG